MRATQAEAMAAADWLNRGDEYRANNYTADYPERAQTGWWGVVRKGLRDAEALLTDAQLIEFSKREGGP